MTIKELFNHIYIPKNKLIVFHARIKSIKECDDFKDIQYKIMTKKLIDVINKNYDPISILIPSYTYSFTHSGIFHRLFSKVETGRFSEEARLMGYYRTPNPIFSFIDTSGYFVNTQVNHNVAFGKGSIFEYFHKNDAVILNIGLDRFIASQRHYAEYYFDVDYRFYKYFQGIIYYNDKDFSQVNYKYYVRYLDRPTDGSLPKITKDLIQENVLQMYQLEGINIGWLSCQPYLDFFKPKMKNDSHYMIM